MSFERFTRTGATILSAAAAAALVLSLHAGPLTAQQGAISGQVVDAATARPLSGAQVFLPELDQGTITNESGEYRISGVPAGTQTVRVRLLGYQGDSRAVQVSAGETVTANFQLAVSAISLDEIVVTQTGVRQRRELGATVSTVDAEQEMAKAKSSTFQDLLKGRSTGTVIRSSSGSVGTSNTFQIRGNASINLDNTPVIYIDGVRINNQNVVGGSGSGFSIGGQTTTRLNDIAPSEIESIEVLKGPAATTLYGSEAAGGVIRITTKSGAGRTDPQFNFRAEAGANFNATDWNALAYNPARGNNLFNFEFPLFNALCNIPGFLPCATTDVTAPDTTYLVDLIELDNAPLAFLTSPFKTGFEQGYAGTVRGALAGGDASYFISGEWQDRKGNTNPNKSERWNGRLNFDFAPNDRVDLTLSNGFASTRTLLPLGDNSGGPISDSQSAFPYVTPIRVARGGATLATCPFEDALHKATGLGFETLNAVNQAIGLGPICNPLNLLTQNSLAPPGFGAPWFFGLSPDEFNAIKTNTDAVRYTGSATLAYRPVDWLTNRLTAGIDLTAQEQEQLVKTVPALGFQGSVNRQNANTTIFTLQATSTAEFQLADELRSTTTGGVQFFQDQTDAVFARGEVLPAGSPAVNNAVFDFGSDFFIEERTLGLFLEQRFGWQGKLFVTGGLRGDDAAAFGGELGFEVFPQANASYVLSEEAWFPDFFDSFRLRGAYGQSGSQPGPNAALSLFEVEPVPFRGGEFSAVSPFDPGNEELKPERNEEIEAGFEFSVAQGQVGGEFTWYKQTTNDAVINAPLPNSAGFPSSPLTNLGEMENTGIEAALDATAFSLPDLEWSWRAQVSTNFNTITELEDPITFGFGLSTLTNRHEEGETFSSVFGFNPFVNEAGELVTPDTAEILGDGTPNVNGSLSSTLTLFEHVTLYALADFATGHQQWSLSSLFNCGIVDILFECARNFEVGPDGETTDLARVLRFASQRAHIGPFVQDADWAKLRTVSLRLDAPDEWTQFLGGRDLSLTLVGDNLAVWTDYIGPDPEVTTLNPSQFGAARVDFAAIPPSRRFTAELSITF